MQMPKKALLLIALPTVFAATAADCQLVANKCDDKNASVMVCGGQGWKMVETCFGVGACHVGTAGNAYCDKEVECTPGESRCDAANYVSKICDGKGFWRTDRKCSKPGCCDVGGGKAFCKPECGPGQQPPTKLYSPHVARDGTKSRHVCVSTGEGHCDVAHGCVLRCNGDNTLDQETCCKEKGGCTYDDASLEPYCK
ncbi:hypothetical protein EKO04_008698 [Ascochyta lentis]|uniref:Uncharacterized protein n=1 Tax=Ascochyta lentis TaxID=205686 RepID=A0A8H7IVW8_9PLEO|nr:hypothetical protein EKO04_008698 [Ascochyta lentis]